MPFVFILFHVVSSSLVLSYLLYSLIPFVLLGKVFAVNFFFLPCLLLSYVLSPILILSCLMPCLNYVLSFVLSPALWCVLCLVGEIAYSEKPSFTLTLTPTLILSPSLTQTLKHKPKSLCCPLSCKEKCLQLELLFEKTDHEMREAKREAKGTSSLALSYPSPAPLSLSCLSIICCSLVLP
jgi:hypothetical protein